MEKQQSPTARDKRILILSPHTDDAEIACGGSIAKWVQSGYFVKFLIFSSARQSLVEQGLPETMTMKESRAALEVLGVQQYHLYDYRVRCFGSRRQEILDDMIAEGKAFKPDLVVMPSTRDTHQDHKTICEEGFRAFKHVSLLGYEMPQNNMTFPLSFFVELEGYHIEKKEIAISKYLSQKDRPYVRGEFARHLATVRGVQAGVNFAEAFEVIRWIL